MSKRPSEFQKVRDPKEALSFLVEGAKIRANTLIWTKNQEQTIKTHLNGLNEERKTLTTWMPRGFNMTTLTHILNKNQNLECYFSLSLPRASIFFKANFAGSTRNFLRFEIPVNLFKVQRRKELRLPLSEAYVRRVEFQDPVFPESRMVGQIVDISANGIGVLLPDQEKGKFQSGTIIHDLIFSIDKKRIICVSEVKHLHPAGKRQIRLGLSFKTLKPRDDQAIAAFVFEENRRYYARFL